jgi:hypothetical protein
VPREIIPVKNLFTILSALSLAVGAALIIVRGLDGFGAFPRLAAISAPAWRMLLVDPSEDYD